jgi:hypothetical protein
MEGLIKTIRTSLKSLYRTENGFSMNAFLVSVVYFMTMSVSKLHTIDILWARKNLEGNAHGLNKSAFSWKNCEKKKKNFSQVSQCLH